MASSGVAVFEMDSVMRGYHIYKDVWQSNTDDILSCRREGANVHDPYAVCMVHPTGIVVGHIPRTISALCDLFLRQGGTISCKITGERMYSVDLPQGGLELPCHLTFSGPLKSVKKLRSLINEAPKLPQGTTSSKEPTKKIMKEEPPSKKIKLDDPPPQVDAAVWMVYQTHRLLISDKMIIEKGDRLTDRHMTFCLAILKAQFPNREGLECTLYQSKDRNPKITSGLQPIHLNNRAYWVLASNVSYCEKSYLNVYDSVFSSADEELVDVLNRLFDFTEHTFVKFQKQSGGSDCGLFVIAAACALLYGQNPISCHFNQEQMRNHLVMCIENCFFSTFPLVVTKTRSRKKDE